ncbi:MAG: NgoFVII family restriction endonuclease [Gammaproteobacteria bacterium]|nr:NgoFVII family restriction endonuclease [Gammaproteobacteria bacterium]
MFTDGLFEKVLVDPVAELDCDSLLSISGYATSAMLEKHLQVVDKLGKSIHLDLTIGMAKNDGIEAAHLGQFRKFTTDGIYKSSGSCGIISTGGPVHSKVFVWMREGKPQRAFAGSANYTLNGFRGHQGEAVGEVDAKLAWDYVNACKGNATSCLDEYWDDRKTKRVFKSHKEIGVVRAVTAPVLSGDRELALSWLVKNTGETPAKSGINWGQRDGRNRNQAYIPVPAEVQKTDFFPSRGEPFTVLTDDEQVIVMVVAQENGKALHSLPGNEIIGEYIRVRLGVSNGEYVTKEHFKAYGRSDLDFTKIDDETFLLDFSVNA